MGLGTNRDYKTRDRLAMLNLETYDIIVRTGIEGSRAMEMIKTMSRAQKLELLQKAGINTSYWPKSWHKK